MKTKVIVVAVFLASAVSLVVYFTTPYEIGGTAPFLRWSPVGWYGDKNRTETSHHNNDKEEEKNGNYNIIGTKRPVLYLHFHKSAGSFLCGYFRSWRKYEDYSILGFRRANCNLPGDSPYPAKRNGLLLMPDPFKLTQKDMLQKYPYLENCSMRSNYAKNMSMPWMFLEKWLPDDGDCTRLFDIVAVIRDPISRIYSHMRVHRHSKERVTRWLTDDALPESDFAFLSAVPAYSNFYTRILLGKKVLFSSKGAITESHLSKAKAMIENEIALMIPLNSTTFGRGLEILAASIGGKKLAAKMKTPKVYDLDDPSFDALLRSHNQFDIRLYAHAMNTFEQRWKEYKTFSNSPAGSLAFSKIAARSRHWP